MMMPTDGVSVLWWRRRMRPEMAGLPTVERPTSGDFANNQFLWLLHAGWKASLRRFAKSFSSAAISCRVADAMMRLADTCTSWDNGFNL